MRSTTKNLKRKNNPERLGDFVRRIRIERGLSLADVSKHAAAFEPRISPSYIDRIEKNPKRRPSVPSLTALAHGLGIPVDELLAHSIRQMRREEADEISLVTRFRELSQKRKSDVWKIIRLWQAEDSSRQTPRPISLDKRLW